LVGTYIGKGFSDSVLGFKLQPLASVDFGLFQQLCRHSTSDSLLPT
jgi:hypothetical protein